MVASTTRRPTQTRPPPTPTTPSSAFSRMFTWTSKRHFPLLIGIPRRRAVRAHPCPANTLVLSHLPPSQLLTGRRGPSPSVANNLVSLSPRPHLPSGHAANVDGPVLTPIPSALEPSTNCPPPASTPMAASHRLTVARPEKENVSSIGVDDGAHIYRHLHDMTSAPSTIVRVTSPNVWMLR